MLAPPGNLLCKIVVIWIIASSNLPCKLLKRVTSKKVIQQRYPNTKRDTELENMLIQKMRQRD